MLNFFNTYKTELIYSAIVIVVLFVIRAIIIITVKKIGKKSGTSEARAILIGRYVTVALVLLALLVEAFILVQIHKILPYYFHLFLQS